MIKEEFDKAPFVSIKSLEDENSDLMKNISLMNSLIDQIGRDNTTVTRGAVKIRLTAMIVRLLDRK